MRSGEVYIPDKRLDKIKIYVIIYSSVSYPFFVVFFVVKMASCEDPEIVFPRGIFLFIWWLNESSFRFSVNLLCSIFQGMYPSRSVHELYCFEAQKSYMYSFIVVYIKLTSKILMNLDTILAQKFIFYIFYA